VTFPPNGGKTRLAERLKISPPFNSIIRTHLARLAHQTVQAMLSAVSCHAVDWSKSCTRRNYKIAESTPPLVVPRAFLANATRWPCTLWSRHVVLRQHIITPLSTSQLFDGFFVVDGDMQSWAANRLAFLVIPSSTLVDALSFGIPSLEIDPAIHIAPGSRRNSSESSCAMSECAAMPSRKPQDLVVSARDDQCRRRTPCPPIPTRAANPASRHPSPSSSRRA
jgi:hypothetical protein